MSRCNRCGITVIDDTCQCPLCKQVLEEDGIARSNKYPDARIGARRTRLFENIILYLSIVAAVAVIAIDQLVSSGINWSILVIILLAYGNVLLRLAIVGKSGYLYKTVYMVILGLICLWAIDHFTGAYGWSVNFAYPGIIILMNIAIIILMLVNRRNWQSYMPMQIFSILLALIPMFLIFTDIVSFPYIIIGAFAMSVLLFLGTLIIGDYRARNELIRRFHI